MKYQEIADKIVHWLTVEHISSKQKGFVVGLSGGVDSALVAKLCAMTQIPTHILLLPLEREFGAVDKEVKYSSGHMRAERYISILADQHPYVTYETIGIADTANAFFKGLGFCEDDMSGVRGLAFANTCSRIRMTYLYARANALSSLVVGTGNKVEDFGVFFYTKYGDGGVDLSPIADLYKSQVIGLAEFLGVPEEIFNAVPSDELWADSRSDEQQLGATYADLELVMKVRDGDVLLSDLNRERYKRTLPIYTELHKKGRHKSKPIPICHIGYCEEMDEEDD